MVSTGIEVPLAAASSLLRTRDSVLQLLFYFYLWILQEVIILHGARASLSRWWNCVAQYFQFSCVHKQKTQKFFQLNVFYFNSLSVFQRKNTCFSSSSILKKMSKIFFCNFPLLFGCFPLLYGFDWFFHDNTCHHLCIGPSLLRSYKKKNHIFFLLSNKNKTFFTRSPRRSHYLRWQSSNQRMMSAGYQDASIYPHLLDSKFFQFFRFTISHRLALFTRSLCRLASWYKDPISKKPEKSYFMVSLMVISKKALNMTMSWKTWIIQNHQQK